MAGFALRPLCLVVFGLFSVAVAHADDPGPPLDLRLERRTNVLLAPKPKGVPEVGIANPFATLPGDAYPLFVTADRMDGRADDVAHARGNAELRKAGAELYAENITYWPLDDEVDAEGDVRMLREGQDIRAPQLRMKLTEQTGTAVGLDFLFVREVQSKYQLRKQSLVRPGLSASNATSGAPMMMHVPASYGLPTLVDQTRPSLQSGSAERAEFEGEDRVRLFDSTFSTCKPGERDWYLKSSELLLDYDTQVGEARDATVYFKDVPIGYAPYATFPLTSGRRSGFFQPSFGVSTRDGIEVFTPYYWNIAPNYDLTFYPRFMSERGVQLSAEARYLSQYTRNITRLEYMPYDKMVGTDRYAYEIRHTQTLGYGLSGVVNWNGVSDNTYWQDLSSRLALTSQTQLPRQVMLNYVPVPWLQGSVNYQRFQTLQVDPSKPVLPPYFFEPQVNFLAFKSNVLNTDLALVGQYTRFTLQNQTSGRPVGDRLYLYPQVSMPFVHPAFTITPKVGLSATQYSLTYPFQEGQENLSRALPVASLDATMFFERETEILGKGFIHTLEPRAYYVKIPYKNQNNFPVFDTGLSDFNFAQIFTENRYSGYDRINDANQLTTALTTRMLSAETGVELFKAMIGQRRYFSDSKVGLPYEVATNSLPSKGVSNVVAAATGLLMPKTYADVAWEYDLDASVNQRFSVGMRYQPELGKVISAGYRYTRDPVTEIQQVGQIDITGQWPLSSRLSVVGRYNYSFLNSQLLEAIVGIEYTSGCWALRVVGQRLEALATEPNTTLFFQLELTDFASIGANPLPLLRRSIGGYGKVNELPADADAFQPVRPFQYQ